MFGAESEIYAILIQGEHTGYISIISCLMQLPPNQDRETAVFSAMHFVRTKMHINKFMNVL